jgi:UTP--glucose-1-phosphate uridylyltransferase
MPHPRIRKAVFPVAGLGTRFLPATKAIPKEMLTVVDRPVIQHVVDEARAAGIEHFVFVTGRGKAVIEDHFDLNFELDRTLKERGKLKERDIVGDEPFALLLPDMLHHGKVPCLKEMIRAYNEVGGNHIAVAPVPDDQTHQYGIVGVKDAKAKVSKITQMVEKPPQGTAPSNLHITGRYILQPSIFKLLAKQERGAGNEIQLTDSMLKLAKKEAFHAVRFDGQIYDTGTKMGFLMANLAYGLARADMSDELRAQVAALLK